MNNAKPMFDPATHYRIDVRGRVDVEWLQSFDSSAESCADETGQGDFTLKLGLSGTRCTWGAFPFFEDAVQPGKAV